MAKLHFHGPSNFDKRGFITTTEAGGGDADAVNESGDYFN